jgi:hypothetical protein
MVWGIIETLLVVIIVIILLVVVLRLVGLFFVIGGLQLIATGDISSLAAAASSYHVLTV